MNFGITLPYLDARKTAELAHLAEDSGWDGVFVGDAIWCLDPMIGLTAAAMLTSRIRLGTLTIPAPLNTPWKLASQSAALDLLCGGRLILGLAMGATWMGWHAFPDVPQDTKTRAEMLDETIDILTQLHQRKQFDYAGKHFKVNLTALDPMHYPPQTIQQPRVPIWIPGAWPRKKSMQRVLKTDGLLAAKMNAEGKFEDVTPADIGEMKAYIDANRSLKNSNPGYPPASPGGLNRCGVVQKTNWPPAFSRAHLFNLPVYKERVVMRHVPYKLYSRCRQASTASWNISSRSSKRRSQVRLFQPSGTTRSPP